MSIRAWLLRKLLMLMKSNGRLVRAITHPSRGNGVVHPQRFGSEFKVDTWDCNGFAALTLTSNVNAGANLPHILFLHGGGYVMEGLSMHRRVVEHLAKFFPLRVTYLDYPLAPEYEVTFCHSVVRAAYAEIIARYHGDRMCLFGDSAGGGLALALLHWLRDTRSFSMPHRTVLFSPWVDAQINHPETVRLEAVDPVLTIDFLDRAARCFAGTEPLSSPRLSPIEAAQNDLGEVLVFASTHELFYHDCKRLCAKMDDAVGTSAELVTEDYMIHDWILAPIPEQKEALRRMGAFFSFSLP